jgi:hypothetical protein
MIFRRPPPFRDPTDEERADSFLMIGYHRAASEFYGERAARAGRRAVQFAIASAISGAFALACYAIGLFYGS